MNTIKVNKEMLKALLELLFRTNSCSVIKDEMRDVSGCDDADYGCSFSRMKWMLSEYKEPIKVNKLEYDILKHLSDNTKYLYITRDRCNGLFLYGMEPTKGDGYWQGKYYAGMSAFNKLFQFIQWEDEEPTSIEEVLNSCEVVNDAKE